MSQLNWQAGQIFQVPWFEVVDGGLPHTAPNTQALTPLQAAIDYQEHSQNQTSRQIEIRTRVDYGIIATSYFTIPYVPPPPLVNLQWASGWPGIPDPCFHLIDGTTHLWAPDPEGWDIERAAIDYGIAPVYGYIPEEGQPMPFVCENREPHTIIIQRTVQFGGQGQWEPFTVPAPEEP